MRRPLIVCLLCLYVCCLSNWQLLYSFLFAEERGFFVKTRKSSLIKWTLFDVLYPTRNSQVARTRYFAIAQRLQSLCVARLPSFSLYSFSFSTLRLSTTSEAGWLASSCLPRRLLWRSSSFTSCKHFLSFFLLQLISRNPVCVCRCRLKGNRKNLPTPMCPLIVVFLLLSWVLLTDLSLRMSTLRLLVQKSEKIERLATSSLKFYLWF